MNLTPVIARFVDASNARDLDAFVSCFAARAVVEDEGRTHRGLAEVRAWKVGRNEGREGIRRVGAALASKGGETAGLEVLWEELDRAQQEAVFVRITKELCEELGIELSDEQARDPSYRLPSPPLEE